MPKKKCYSDLYLFFPVIHTACFTSINVLGSLIGHELVKLTGLVSKNSSNNYIPATAAGSAISISALSFCMLAWILCTHPTSEKRYSEAVQCNAAITAANIPISFLTPFLTAFFIFKLSLEESGLASLCAGFGTTGIMIGFYLTYFFYNSAKNCHQNMPVQPMHPSETYAVEIDRRSANIPVPQ